MEKKRIDKHLLQLFVLLWEDMRRENVSLSVERSGDRPTTGGQETVPQQAGKRGTGTSRASPPFFSPLIIDQQSLLMPQRFDRIHIRGAHGGV